MHIPEDCKTAPYIHTRVLNICKRALYIPAKAAYMPGQEPDFHLKSQNRTTSVVWSMVLWLYKGMLAFKHLVHFRASLPTYGESADMWECRRVRFWVILVPGFFPAIYFSDQTMSWRLKQPKTSKWLVQEIQIWRQDKCPKILWFWSILSCDRI